VSFCPLRANHDSTRRSAILCLLSGFAFTQSRRPPPPGPMLVRLLAVFPVDARAFFSCGGRSPPTLVWGDGGGSGNRPLVSRLPLECPAFIPRPMLQTDIGRQSALNGLLRAVNMEQISLLGAKNV
jgi:hypothetical protein